MKTVFSHYTKVLPIIILAFACIFIYAGALNYPFLWDDEVLIVENPLIRSLANTPNILTSKFWAGSGNYYRPLPVLTYALDFRFWKLNPFGYHLTNLILHLTGVIFVYLILRRVFGKSAALAASLIYAVHPVCSSLVQPVFGRPGMLEVLLLATFFFFQRAPDKEWMEIACILSFGAALLAKESAMIFPLVPAAYAALYFDRRRIQKTVPVFAAIFLILAVYIASRFIWLPFRSSNPLAPIADLPLHWRLWTFAGVPLRYLGLWIFPLHLHNERHFTSASPADPMPWLGLGFMCLLLAAGIKFRKRHPFVLFGTLWFLIGLVPTCHPIRIPITMAEHWIYVPAVGLVWISAGILKALLAHPGRRGLVLAALMLLVSVYSARTLVRLRDWKDPITLYRADLRHAPGSFVLHNNLAVELFRKGDLAGAEKEFLAANKIEPRYGTTTNNLGVIAMRKGDAAGAEAYYRLSIRQSGYALAYVNLARLLLRQNQPDKALDVLRQAGEEHPFHTEIRGLLRKTERSLSPKNT